MLVKPEGPICMLCSPGRLPAKSGHHVSRHHQITSVRERFIDLKRTIKYGLKRTIQDCWHRAGFVAIGELLLEPIRPIQCRTHSHAMGERCVRAEDFPAATQFSQRNRMIIR